MWQARLGRGTSYMWSVRRNLRGVWKGLCACGVSERGCVGRENVWVTCEKGVCVRRENVCGDVWGVWRSLCGVWEGVCTWGVRGTASCIWSVISSISELNRCSSSLGLFCHVPLERVQGDWDWRLRLEIEIKDTPNAIGYSFRGKICVRSEK